MKELPEVNANFADLYGMLVASIRSKLLLTGIELKVFNQLNEPKSAEAVAGAIGTHPVNTRLFLDGLAANNLVIKNKGLYQNTSVTQTTLMEGSPTFIGEMFTLMSQMQDAIDEEYDLIWASATLNFARHDLDTPVRKIYDALNPGGVFVSFSDGLSSERTKPENYVLSTLPSALMGQDMGIDQGVIADSMLRAGFKSVRSRTIDTPMMPMDLDIGRKA